MKKIIEVKIIDFTQFSKGGFMHGKISRGRVGYTLKFFRARVSGYTWKNSRGRVPPKCGAPGVGWLRFSYSYGELCDRNNEAVETSYF